MASTYYFGPYTLDERERLLRRNGTLIPVPPKALETLVVLVCAGDRVVTRGEILETVWPETFVEDSNVTQNIFLLRKLLEPPEGEPTAIQTVPRRGYRFTWAVEARAGEIAGGPRFEGEGVEAAGDGVAGLKHEPAGELIPDRLDGSPGQQGVAGEGGPDFYRQLRRVRQPFWRTGLALMVLLVTVASGFAIRWRVQAAALRRQKHVRLAVLTFANLSGRPEDAWLGTALPQLLGNDLESDARLQVIPLESVERAERELALTRTDGLNAATLRKVCGDLDCDELVTGSYLVSNGQIRLDARLIAVQNGEALGSFSTTVTQDQVLPLAVATDRSLRASLGEPAADAASESEVAAAASGSTQAYQLYIEGVEKLRAFDGRGASQLLEQSIALDPKFALSHLELSSAMTVLGQEDRAVAEALKAQALAGSLSREEQLQIEARVMQTQHEYDKGAAIYGTLLTFYPEKLDFARMQASLLDYAGHLPEAEAELQKVVSGPAPESHDPRFYSALADCYSDAGDWPASLAWAQKGEIESKRRGALILYERVLTTETQALYHLGQLQPALDKTEEALGLARRFEDYSGELRALNRVGQIETAMGRLPEARAALEQALKREAMLGEKERQIHTLSALGENLLKSGEPRKALAVFEQGLTVARWYNQADYVAVAELNVASAEVALGQQAKAADDLRRVSAEAERVGDKETIGKAEAMLAELKR